MERLEDEMELDVLDGWGSEYKERKESRGFEEVEEVEEEEVVQVSRYVFHFLQLNTQLFCSHDPRLFLPQSLIYCIYRYSLFQFY